MSILVYVLYLFGLKVVMPIDKKKKEKKVMKNEIEELMMLTPKENLFFGVIKVMRMSLFLFMESQKGERLLFQENLQLTRKKC